MDSEAGAADIEATPRGRRPELHRVAPGRWALVGSRVGELLVAAPEEFVDVEQ